MSYRALPELVRFMNKVEPCPMTGCWLWTGALFADGYGAFFRYVGIRQWRAHRASWAMFKGQDPGDLMVLHHCDVPSCVNPAHLFLGTVQDNSDDMVRKNRTYIPPSSPEHRRAKLTAEQVRAIRADCRSQEKIALAYGVAQATIGRLKRGESYRLVEQE